jgi:pimeloyl-ACP methyl ester carboxylesterase
VPSIAPPPFEGEVPVDGGSRHLGVAGYGDPHGPLVLWCHGTPGARRQIPPIGRRAAAELGLHLVCVERPGVGSSTQHGYHRVADFAADAAQVADHFGADELAVVGLSGGGPYALACGALLRDRVRAVGILGGVCPSKGSEAAATGVVALAHSFRHVLHQLRLPMGAAFRGAIVLLPVAHLAYQAYTRTTPPGDQVVLRDPEIEAMFVDDLGSALQKGFGALAHDAALFGRHWGFEVASIEAPVRWWHGDSDVIVSLGDAQATCARIRDIELHVRPGESHLGGFAAADEVLATMSALL